MTCNDIRKTDIAYIIESIDQCCFCGISFRLGKVAVNDYFPDCQSLRFDFRNGFQLELIAVWTVQTFFFVLEHPVSGAFANVEKFVSTGVN